jgi:hypothetical protein
VNAIATRSELREIRARIGREAYQRACREAMWREGDLSYALNDSQRELRSMFYSRRSRRYVAKIARRWGKTRTCSVLAFESALRGPQRRILYAAQTQTAVKEFVAPHFLDLAADAPDDMRPDLVANEMRFRNGSRIVLQGCEDQLKADRLRGPAAHDAFVDEGGYIPILRYVVTSIVRPQLSTTRGSMLIASSPPESPDHEFEDFAIEAETKGAFMRRDIYDAPHVPADEIAQWCEDVGGPESIAWMREGLALSIIDPTRAVVPEFSALESSLVCEWPRPAHFNAFVVGDLGYVDLTVIAFAIYDFERATLVIEDEIALRRPTSDVVQARASAKARELWGEQRPLVRALDGPAMTVADVARLEAQPLAEGADEPARWGAVFNGEITQAVNALRVLVKRGRLRVHPRCRTIIAHLRSARWNDARTSFMRVHTDEGQHHYDGAAAVVYLAREARAREHVNPAPLLPPGVHPHLGMRVPPDLMRDPRHDRIRQAFNPRKTRR